MAQQIARVRAMSRMNWDEYFMLMALLAAKRGTCDRKQVGAILVSSDNTVIATGYNGTPSGVPHCDDVGHTLAEIDGRESCIATLHAESNALDQAKVSLRDAALYTSVIPCFDCAKRIVNAGIKTVHYYEYYESRKTAMVEKYLDEHGVRMFQRIPPVIQIGGELNDGQP
jgi:dCMP deaminase